MSLKSIIIPAHTVEYAGGTIAVRGLDMGAVIHLVREQRPQLQAAYEKAAKGELSADDIGEAAVKLLEDAPDLCGHLIATAAGEPDEWEKARSLPAPVQLDLLEGIGRLTFAMEGGPKKVLETVIRVMQSATGLTDEIALPT